MTNFFFLGYDNIKVRFTWPQLQHIPYAVDYCDAFLEAGCNDDEFIIHVPLVDARRLIHLRNLLEAVIVTEVDLSGTPTAHFTIPGLDATCVLPFVSYTAPWMTAIPGWPRAFLATLAAFSGEDLLDLFSTTGYLGMWNVRKAIGYRILWRLAADHRVEMFEDVEDTWTEEEFHEGVASLPFDCQTLLLYLFRQNAGGAI